MPFLENNPKNPQKGAFGLGKPTLMSSSSPAIEAIADETILIKSLRNPSFFEVLVDRYQDGFLRTAYRVVRSREEAEDIVQEAFIKLYRNAKKFTPQPGATFKSWAYRILMNTAFTHYRKLKKKDVNLEEFFDVILFTEAEQKGRSFNTQLEKKDHIGRALEQIPEDLAELIKLHYFEGYSYEDISSVKGLPVSTLKMRLYRARKVVKKYLWNVMNEIPIY